MRPITFCAERLPNGGAARPIPIDLAKSPHVLIVGGTGSGKSVASLLLCAKISLHYPRSKTWIIDPKGDNDTFGFLNAVESCRYWQFADSMAGLQDYYDVFQSRLTNEPKDGEGLRLLWCDEWASMILNLPKKDAEEAKAMLATVLMMGRSKGCFVLCSLQRASAELFTQGARDNFSVSLALGNISKEQASMLGFLREDFVPVTRVGGGHLLLNGTNQMPVQVPLIGERGMERIKRDILLGVTR